MFQQIGIFALAKGKYYGNYSTYKDFPLSNLSQTMFRQLSSVCGRFQRVVILAGGVVALTGAAAQVTEPTPVFGFVRTALQGSKANSGVTFMGPSFVEQAVAEATLAAGSPPPFLLTATGVSWGANAFKTHPRASSHYVEIKDSANYSAVGLMSDIVSHTATTLTIADDFSTMLRGGETLVIRPHKTLAGVFGAANEAGLGSGDAGTADVISILAEGSSASFTTYYYRAGATLGGTGWRSSSNPFEDQAQTPLKTGQGLIVKRRRAEPLELLLQGYVRRGLWRRTLPSGYSLVDPLAPITDQSFSAPAKGLPFTLGGVTGSGVIPSGLGAALSPGTPQTADLVSLAGTMASFYNATAGGLSSGGWRLTSNPFADQATTVVPAASAILIQNRGEPKRWTRPQPFVVSTP